MDLMVVTHCLVILSTLAFLVTLPFFSGFIVLGILSCFQMRHRSTYPTEILLGLTGISVLLLILLGSKGIDAWAGHESSLTFFQHVVEKEQNDSNTWDKRAFLSMIFVPGITMLGWAWVRDSRLTREQVTVIPSVASTSDIPEIEDEIPVYVGYDRDVFDKQIYLLNTRYKQ